MSLLRRFGLIIILASSIGCARTGPSLGDPADPQISDAVLTYWQALERREWRAAFSSLHPGLRSKGMTLKRFTEFHTRRLNAKGITQAIRIVGCERTGDDAVVSLELYVIAPPSSEAALVPPRRRVHLRKHGGSWMLLTHDLLAVGMS